MQITERSRTVSVPPGHEIQPVVEAVACEQADATGGARLRFQARTGRLARALVGFDDLRACCYRQVSGEDVAVVSLDGEVDCSPGGARTRASAVLEGRDGLHLSGRLLEASAGAEGLELLLLEGGP